MIANVPKINHIKSCPISNDIIDKKDMLIIKFPIQFDEEVIPTAVDLKCNGKISEFTVQTPPPTPKAKNRINTPKNT